MDSISKRSEALIRSLSTRHGRRDSDFCMCDGLRASSEIIAKRPDLLEFILIREDMADKITLSLPIKPVILPEREFERVTSTVHSQGIITVAKRPAMVPVDAPIPDPFVLVLDRVGDPGNFGTILRTARACGLHEVWLTKGTADPFSEKIVRSASGAQFALGIRMTDTLEELASILQKAGYPTIWRTLPASGENVFQAQGLFEKSAIVLGCEATGVAELPGSRGVNIPMPGDAESLNVAQAATVILFEYVRRITT